MNIIELIARLFRKRQPLPNSLIPEGPKETDAIYDQVFGATIADFTGLPSRDWRKYEPNTEYQGFGDCVSFSRLNCAETVAKAQGIKDEFGEEFNFSDLWLAVKSGTTQNGNNMGTVAETARKTGVVLEQFCPYTTVWEQRQGIVNATPGTAKRYMLGNYSWVKGDTNMLKDALQYSPVQIGIGLDYTYNTADVVPKPASIRAYHAITLQYIDSDGKFYIFDHYQKKNKVLAADYPITYAMSFRDLPEEWRGIAVPGQTLYNRLSGKYVIRVQSHGEVYHVWPLSGPNGALLQKVEFIVTDNELFALMQKYFRDNKTFIGISENDWNTLSQAVVALGGKVNEQVEEKISSLELVK